MPISGYFDTPFCLSGTKTTVPDPVQTGGEVSYTQGYGPDYTLEPGSPGALNVQNYEMNQIFYDITTAIQNWQQNTIAPFITSVMNGGSAYSYPQYAMVLYSGVGYISNTGSNTDTPPSSKWTALNLGSSGGFYSGGVTTGSAAAQTLATVTPAGFSLSNDGSTVGCTAGFACPGACTFAIAGTTATSAKIWNGTSYVDPAANQFLLDETIFLTVNATHGIYVITDAPTLGTVAKLNTDGTNFQASGNNLAFGSAPVLPNGTTATTQSGSDNSTKVATTAQVQAAIALQVITKGTPLVINPYANSTNASGAHGLSSVPDAMFCYLECLSAEGNYSVGDRVPLSSTLSSGGALSFGGDFDASNTYFSSTAATPNIMNKTTTAGITITPAKWKLVLTPYIY